MTWVVRSTTDGNIYVINYLRYGRDRRKIFLVGCFSPRPFSSRGVKDNESSHVISILVS